MPVRLPEKSRKTVEPDESRGKVYITLSASRRQRRRVKRRRWQEREDRFGCHRRIAVRNRIERQ